MTYDDILVLIPSHSLEDFPSELGEKPSEGLLNAFAVAWHPVLLSHAQKLPRWQRADDTPPVQPNRLVICPTHCTDQVPESWVERARREGMNVVIGLSERQALLEAVLAPLDPRPAVDPELAADFIAFGHIYIQSELLTRHMRNFSHLDEPHLQREVVAAAKAACSGDAEAARKHLGHCFEMLLEGRERFYPVDSYLLDLCLVIPRLGGEKFQAVLRRPTSLNVMILASDLEQIEQEHPESIRLLREGLDAGRVELIGGEYTEVATPLLDPNATIEQLSRGRRVYERILGRAPTIWGRRRYGVGRQMPQLLGRSGFTGGMHFVMDDGFYPDEEQSKLRWEGCDGSTLDAYSRIPLAGDSASSYLRLPVRIAESMDHDHVSGICIARWPDMRTPWLEDLFRGEKFAPVLGKFATFTEFFGRSEHSGRHVDFKAESYLSPFFVQAVARQEANPISRHIDWQRRCTEVRTAAWCQSIAAMLWGRPWPEAATKLKADCAAAHPDAPLETTQSFDAALPAAAAEARARIAEVMFHGTTAGAPGRLVLNPLAMSRKVIVEDSGKSPADSVSIVEVPSCGFAWLPNGSSGSTSSVPAGKQPPPMAEGLTLRNELFEVLLSDVTGGIGQVRTYHRSPNRVSQQLAFRFGRERTFTIGEGDEVEQIKSYYSDMRMTGSRILSTGPVMGAIETIGEILDQQTDQPLATFKQTVRVFRGKPIVEMLVELETKRSPEGDPWSNYFCSRFAWKDGSAAITRSSQLGAHPVGEQERIEAPHYIEIAAESWRTTILPCGLPFHRLAGDRMLDSILIAEGETRRQFRMVVAVDEQFPLQAALDAMTPPVVLNAEKGPPAVGASGWLIHVGAKNVILLSLHPLYGEQETVLGTGSGFAVRLLETEGRSKTFKLRCFKRPTAARQRDFRGHTVKTLQVEGDDVLVTIGAHEIVEAELTFS
jgi:alpha-mannosidase